MAYEPIKENEIIEIEKVNKLQPLMKCV